MPPDTRSPDLPVSHLPSTLRVSARYLGQRIDVRAGWDDLVLPDTQRQVLFEIAAQVQQRGRVYGQWGFQAKSNRGLGISALFAGPSGTGKTMAAEVLAKDENVLADPSPDIFISAHADSSINVLVRPWCNSENFWPVYFGTHEQVKLAFDRDGITIPFPQRDLHIKGSVPPS